MFSFTGLKQFVWFIGVIEDRNDPQGLGRVKVRCYGYHTKDKIQIKTEDLPWAVVMLPTTSPSVSGIGYNPFLVEGSWVVGFFMDGESAQEPCVMGSIPGAPKSKPDKNEGFSDPNGKYPTLVGESDINRRVRNSSVTKTNIESQICLLYTSPSPRDRG